MMNIVLGDNIKYIPDSFTILELDTFTDPSKQHQHTAWCVVENIPLADFPILEQLCATHENLIRAYKQRDWAYCKQAVDYLMGRWDGELDSFYQDLKQRVEHLENDPPGPDWTPLRVKI
jgi:hypothetical protein